jgi:hypothetical protein
MDQPRRDVSHSSLSSAEGEERLELCFLRKSLCNGNEGASSAVSDVERHIFIRESLKSLFNMRSVFVRRWEIETYVHRIFLPLLIRDMASSGS